MTQVKSNSGTTPPIHLNRLSKIPNTEQPVQRQGFQPETFQIQVHCVTAKHEPELYLQIQFVPRSKQTASPLPKPVS
jgi:hypothetical protein